MQRAGLLTLTKQEDGPSSSEAFPAISFWTALIQPSSAPSTRRPLPSIPRRAQIISATLCGRTFWNEQIVSPEWNPTDWNLQLTRRRPQYTCCYGKKDSAQCFVLDE